MPGSLTELTEISTALGMLDGDLDQLMTRRPLLLRNVPDEVWGRLVDTYRRGNDQATIETAFANGRAFRHAVDGLRGRPPLRVEWKGPQRPPGDDVAPADLRVDYVYLVSCKYLSKVLVNPGPPRLFDRLMVGDQRSTVNWFWETAPREFEALYQAARHYADLPNADLSSLPTSVVDLTKPQQLQLKGALRQRQWPQPLVEYWLDLCRTVSEESARRWQAAMTRPLEQRQLLWRLLRITTATYFVLGVDKKMHLRVRVDSAWDWMQSYQLQSFSVTPRPAGQPEVAWTATVKRLSDGAEQTIDGHVEIRWSHGRFVGSPEAKVYLDTDYALVPGYHPLS